MNGRALWLGLGLVAVIAALGWNNCMLRQEVRRATGPEAARDRPEGRAAVAGGAGEDDDSFWAARERAEAGRGDPGAGASPRDALTLGPLTITGSAAAVARTLMPQPGETWGAYRDRVVPLAQTAVAPQRARVKRWRDELVSGAGLDARQQQLLDESAAAAGDALKDHIMNAVVSGELMPPNLRGMKGVRFAHEFLGLLIQAEARFRAGLTSAQQAALDAGRFDFADYVLFNTRWEDLFGYQQP